MDKDTLRAIEIINDIFRELGDLYYTFRNDSYIGDKRQDLSKIINDIKNQ